MILKVDQFWEQAIDGFLLLVAIGLDRLLALRLAAALTKRSGRTMPHDLRARLGRWETLTVSC